MADALRPGTSALFMLVREATAEALIESPRRHEGRILRSTLAAPDPRPISPHALFVEYEAEDGSAHAPEVFPRPDGTTYVCDLPSTAPVSVDPAAVEPDPDALERLRAMTARFAPAFAEAEGVAAQVAGDGLPLIGPRAPSISPPSIRPACRRCRPTRSAPDAPDRGLL